MFHLAHSHVILVTINDHLYISFTLEIDQCLDVCIQMEECEEYESVKRPHVTSGNSPHKPEDKCSRTVTNLSNTKKLSFPRSPAKVVST